MFQRAGRPTGGPSRDRKRRRPFGPGVDRLEPRVCLAAHVTIDEFMAANVSVLADENGQFHDWIEIRNNEAAPLNLQGWRLTDNELDLSKWVFPSVTVPAGGRLVVFARNNSDKTGPQFSTNFSLSDGGEYLALVAPDGTVTTAFDEYPAQQANVSYGRDGSTFRYFATPSPGAANARSEVVITEIHHDSPIETETTDFVELFNPGTVAVDLSGASFTSGIDYTFPAGTVLGPGKYLVVAQDAADFQAKFGALPFGQFVGGLSNDGETVRLKNAAGGTLDEVGYGQGFPWPTVGLPTGHSIQLINVDLDNDLGGSWRSAAPTVSPTAPGNVSLFPSASPWSYRENGTDPGTAWRNRVFTPDGTWFSGVGPFGYDTKGTPTMGTTLNVINSTGGAPNARSASLRRTFTIANLADVASLRLEALWDDGFSVWINGANVYNSAELNGAPAAWNAFSPGPARENNNYVSIPLSAANLVAGTNAIAVQFHNVNNSSDAFFDARLSYVPAATAAAGAPNAAIAATNAPPAVRRVSHLPQQPTAGQPVTITAKVTDPDDVSFVQLKYQRVLGGAYINHLDAAYNDPSNWTTLTMRDDGTNGDLFAGDATYTVVIPAAVQVHRGLVRYRITTTDGLGANVTVPYADDPVPNFAYYTYNGVPDWQGAANPSVGPTLTYTGQALSTVPVIQLITKRQDHLDAQYLPGTTRTGGYGGEDYPWAGTLIYNGVVYDHVHYRARGGVWRYAMGKNMWKIDFNKGHDFQFVDAYGKPQPVKWTKLNLGANIQQGNFGQRGEQGLFEHVGFQVFNLAGAPGSNTLPIHFRIVEDRDELGVADGLTQYDGDFQGMYLAVEQDDGRFLESHDLPDGNLYRMESGTGALNNQGPTQPSDKSDLVAFQQGLANNPTDQWIRDNVDLEQYYNYRAVVEMIHHWDIGFGKNYYWFHNPDTGKWMQVPWDLDLTWTTTYEPGGGDAEPFRNVILGRETFAIEYRNRLRELRDLMWNPEQVGLMLDAYADLVDRPGNSLVEADRAMWDYNPILVSDKVNISKAGHGRFYGNSTDGTFRGMVQRLKQYVATRANYIDTSTLATQQLLGIDDAAAPLKRTVGYTGGAGFPIDNLRFATQAFAPGNQGGSFAAMEWRIADVTATGLLERKNYEINAAWESGEITGFNSQVQVPATAVVPGRTYRVRVRFKDTNGRWGHWSDVQNGVTQFTTSAAASPVRDSLRVVEVHYNPDGNGPFDKDEYEFVELKNLGQAAINLQGARFTEGLDFTFPSIDLAPGESVVVVKNLAAFRSRYSTVGMKVAGEYVTDNLNNNGETLTLVDKFGQTIQSFSYDDEGTWPLEANGVGRSLVFRNPTTSTPLLNWSDGKNWRASVYDRGTPGADESAVAVGAVVVNEVLTHTDNPFGDRIELHNTTNAAIDVSNWWLSDDNDSPQKFRLPANTVIPANGFVVFDQFPDFGVAGNPGVVEFFGLSELGDRAVLSSANAFGVLSGYHDDLAFGAIQEEVTVGRYTIPSTGGVDVATLALNTIGSANSGPLIGPVVISEFRYLPATGMEYVELRNITSSPVPLFDANGNVWQFTSGITFAFPANTTLAANEIVLVVPVTPAEFRDANPSIPANVRIFGPYAGILSDTGETITLSMPGLPEPDLSVPYYSVDSVTYTAAAPWAVPTGDAALSRVGSVGYGNDPASWQVESPAGSIGKPNFDTTAPTATITPVSPDPRDSAVSSITITFSEPVAGFDLSDLRLLYNNLPHPDGILSASLSTTDNVTWTLSGLQGLTLGTGNYTLTLNADGQGSGIRDAAGLLLANSPSDAFQVTQSALDGTDAADAWTVRELNSILYVWHNVDPSLPPSFSVPRARLTNLTFRGKGGDDTLALDFTSGSPAPGGGVNFLGGAGADSIRFLGIGQSALYTPHATAAFRGTVGMASLGAASFEETESVVASGLSNVTLRPANPADSVTVDASPGLPGHARVSGTSGGVAFTPLSFTNVPSLTVDLNRAGDADDTLTVIDVPATGFTSLTAVMGSGTNAVNVAGGAFALTIPVDATAGTATSLFLSGAANVTLPGRHVLASVVLTDNARAKLTGGASARLRTTSLTLDEAARLDLGESDMIVDFAAGNSPLPLLRTFLHNGRLGGNLPSIVTSKPAAPFGADVAMVDNNLIRQAMWGGETLSTTGSYNQLLFRPTYAGDADLDLKVTEADYQPVTANLSRLNSQWLFGDLNHDGVTNADDFALVTANLGAGADPGAGQALVSPTPATRSTTPSTTTTTTVRLSPLTRPKPLPTVQVTTTARPAKKVFSLKPIKTLVKPAKQRR